MQDIGFSYKVTCFDQDLQSREDFVIVSARPNMEIIGEMAEKLAETIIGKYHFIEHIEYIGLAFVTPTETDNLNLPTPPEYEQPTN